jgi:hypothetical protein
MMGERMRIDSKRLPQVRDSVLLSARAAAVLVLLAIVPACDVLSVKHMAGERTKSPCHLWHALPFYLVFDVVSLAVDVVLLPAELVEFGITGDFPLFGDKPGLTAWPGDVAGIATGYAAALPFFVAAFPVEIVYQHQLDEEDRKWREWVEQQEKKKEKEKEGDSGPPRNRG